MGRILEKGKVAMKTKEFLKKHMRIEGASQAVHGEEMADVWDAMIKQDRHDWLSGRQPAAVFLTPPKKAGLPICPGDTTGRRS